MTYLKRMFYFKQNSHFSRYLTYLEVVVIGSLLIMLIAQLMQLLSVNVWRQDSMYYVVDYKDKLVSEGRWINNALFDFLRIIPAQVCILLSYSCLGYFVYAVCEELTDNWRYTAAIVLLVLNIPVLSVQLEWPETLLFAFVLLPIAVFEAKKLPDYIFFPLFSILFFGSFSAFYFLLPLLFLRDLNPRRFIRLLVIWIACFVVGYLVTNQIIHYKTGHYVEIAGWRHPHPAKSIGELIDNIHRVYGYFSMHMQRFHSVVGDVFYVALLFALVKCRSVNAALIILISICCALCIYITVIPVGIIVQERTALSFWVPMIIAAFALRDPKGYYRFFGLILIFVLGFNMGKASYASVKSYADVTKVLVDQIQKAMPLAPAETHNVFLVVRSEDAHVLFNKIERNIHYKHYFSETMWGPQNWVSSFKSLGYNNIIVCVDEENGWCKDAAALYKQVDKPQPDEHMFVAYRAGQDVILTINQAILQPGDMLLKD